MSVLTANCPILHTSDRESTKLGLFFLTTYGHFSPTKQLREKSGTFDCECVYNTGHRSKFSYNLHNVTANASVSSGLCYHAKYIPPIQKLEIKDRKTQRQKSRKTERQKDRKTDRQKGRKTERQKDRKIARQQERKTERQNERMTE